MPSHCLYLEDILCPVELVICVKVAIHNSVKHFHTWKYLAGPSSFSDVGQFSEFLKARLITPRGAYSRPLQLSLYGFRIQNCDNLPGEYPRCLQRRKENILGVSRRGFPLPLNFLH